MKKLSLLTSVRVLGIGLTGCGSIVSNLNSIEYPNKNYTMSEKIDDKTENFALANGEIKLKTQFSDPAKLIFYPRILDNSEKINCALTKELEKVILSKGFSVTDTYDSINNMTYTEKKKTTAVLYPSISIYFEESGESTMMEKSNYLISSDSMIEVKAKISLIMLEPLSKEKIWIKDLKTIVLDPIKVSYLSNDAYQVKSTATAIHENYEDKAKEIDEKFIKIYDEVLGLASKYIEKEEFIDLKSDITKLKGIKRY